MKKTLLLAASFLCIGSLMAQTVNVAFQPDATTGEDAYIWSLDGGCVLTGTPPPFGTNTPADVNFGNAIQLPYMDWTWNAANCPNGTIRSVIRFSQLNTIPSNSIINNATLRLYGVQTSEWGPNSWPSTNSGFFANPGWLSRITAPWNESTITWNNFNANTNGNITTAGQVAIPPSASEWGWNPAINVTPLVQNITNGTFPNYGWQMSLQTEDIYRAVVFASSDHTVPALRPRLEINYTRCADFEHCFSSMNVDIHNFTALNPLPGYTYTWDVNGNLYSGTSITVNFASLVLPVGATTFDVTLTATGNGNVCTKTNTICRYNSNSFQGSCAAYTVCTKTTAPNTFVLQAIFPLSSPSTTQYAWAGNFTNAVVTYPNGINGNMAVVTFSAPPPPNFGWAAELGVVPISGPFSYICRSQIKLCYTYNPPRPAKETSDPNDGSIPQYTEMVPPDVIQGATSRVFPNPTTTGWTLEAVKATRNDKMTTSVFDITGKLIYSQEQALNPGTNKINIPGNNIPPGIYILEAKQGSVSFKEKIVKIQ
ncbi:DNRLRE domain-containing protein [Taibaiella koreensis]|uniref:DNRLRE domain-containing protein n=1 Tax=Taibaiella koreensis TaxID=1268548 RepID=UPI000E59C217|nr:DNRLRE domain-containing protein [Taibaiella koreensis]